MVRLSTPILYTPMTLTDIVVRTSKPTDKPQKLGDSGGLYLLIHPNGSKYWRLKYRYLKKEKTLSFGIYPQNMLDATERDWIFLDKKIKQNQ